MKKTEFFVQKQPISSNAMIQQHSKTKTNKQHNDEFHDANKKQKQTLQLSKQQPKAEQKLVTRLPKKKRRNTSEANTNNLHKRWELTHTCITIMTLRHKIKTKHCTDEGKSVTTQTNASHLHPHSITIIIINVIFMITTAINRLNHAAISFQGKVEAQSQFE